MASILWNQKRPEACDLQEVCGPQFGSGGSLAPRVLGLQVLQTHGATDPCSPIAALGKSGSVAIAHVLLAMWGAVIVALMSGSVVAPPG